MFSFKDVFFNKRLLCIYVLHDFFFITYNNTLYKTGNAREHSYRGDLQNLIMAILPEVLVNQRTRKSSLWRS